MNKTNKRNASISNSTINMDDMITSYPKTRMIILCVIMLMLIAVAVASFVYKSYICAVGIIAFVIYIISMTFGQKSSDYKFEFKSNSGLSGMRIFYREKELKLEYRLDKNGKFMWADSKKEANCISYADGSKMNKYIIKYRILNYINVFMEQNGLKSDHAW